ncbi:hypothetical protein D6D27_09758 [Aureobasidium pullulans]|nr:hypothetical protein D6D27_09758 [Aureobasidium pullulans]
MHGDQKRAETKPCSKFSATADFSSYSPRWPLGAQRICPKTHGGRYRGNNKPCPKTTWIFYSTS